MLAGAAGGQRDGAARRPGGAVRPFPVRRLGAVVLLALAVGPVAGGRETDPSPGRPIRVLVYEGAGPVTLAGPGREARIEAVAGRLRIEGRVRSGPVRFGSLESESQLGADPYRGALVASPDPTGLRVVNEVPLEDYVAGTLLREVYHGWPQAVLRAQAVVIRTYALHQAKRARRRGQAHDLRAGTQSQVYGGRAAETPQARRAAADTESEYLDYGGDPILAVYHATSGGRTASAAETWGEALPYLVSVPVPGEEESPDTYWRTPVTRPILERALERLGHQLGAIQAVRITDRTPSGRVRALTVIGAAGSARIAARDLRRELGARAIRSTRFEVRADPDGFVFAGSGRGHGVGMSQWGAKTMAERGASYREILAWFYPGARLRRLAPATPAQRADASP